MFVVVCKWLNISENSRHNQYNQAIILSLYGEIKVDKKST